MPSDEFAKDLREEVRAILASDFAIEVTKTKVVPHNEDNSITFPDLVAKRQGTKLLETCVLYVDIRRSTELNLTHRPQTVAKLYSAFVRAMTRCATQHQGHVRGIIGDRVMVLFDADKPFENAVRTAIAMNSVSSYVLDKHFSHNEVSCGIGIDFGKMLATKTGFRRHGSEQQSYRALVWLGRPANVASKLTDIANKPSEQFDAVVVHTSYDGSAGPKWQKEAPHFFVQNLDMKYVPPRLVHKNPLFSNMFVMSESMKTRVTTPAILMTKRVYDGFRAACPQDACVTNSLFKKVDIKLTDYAGEIYGGNVIFPSFKTA